jgi:gliding motility associated protien GldN
MKKLVYAIVVFGFLEATAQEYVPIVKPEVPEEYVLFKKTVTRRMNLKEKQNRPFFSKNGELSALIIEAVNAGLIKPYASDSCINIMPDDIFQDRIRIKNQASGFGGGGFGGGFSSGCGNDNQQPENQGPTYTSIPPDLFSVVYLKEDVIFDRNRSRMYYYIRSITIALPGGAETAQWNEAGFEKTIASFKYEDLVALFRGPFADRAIWYNRYNQAQHVNFSDAFELRLFRAPIFKVSNPENTNIRQEFAELIARDPINGPIVQQQFEYEIMEYESNLWEY